MLAFLLALLLAGCGHEGAARRRDSAMEEPMSVPLGGDPLTVVPDLDPNDAPSAEPPPSDPAEIQRVVKAHSGRVQACVERSLRVDPRLEGTVGVGFTVAGGAVTEAHLVRNTTGDAAMGACVVGAVRSFQFDPGTSAEVAEYPWVVSGR